jgi:hypothetical protein
MGLFDVNSSQMMKMKQENTKKQENTMFLYRLFESKSKGRASGV